MQKNNKNKKEEGVNVLQDIKVYDKTMVMKIFAKGEKWHK